MKLAKIFSDGMVLQRNKPIRVFGTGAGEVKVNFLGDEACLVTERDKWLVELPAHPEGGPYKMTISMNGEIVEIKDIWIGEVWIAAGQSNMSFMFWEMYKRGIAITDLEENDKIHFFKTFVDTKLQYDENETRWIECTKSKIMSDYSIIPYYFALKLQQKLDDNIHVAILNASRGWTRIESWIPSKYIDGSDLDLDRSIKNLAPASDIPNGRLFEGYVRAFVPISANGIIWYQGESNTGIDETKYYSELLELLISSWRTEFCDELPILLVQLATYGDSMESTTTIAEKCLFDDDGPQCRWAKLREQQLITSKKVKDVFLVTTIDTGEFKQIHPTGKDKVGERLAIAANNIASNKNEEYTGPIFEKMRVEGNRAIITFSHADGLCIDKDIDYICICAEDEIYHQAECEVVNNELSVYSDKVAKPYGVKYAFCNWATGGIKNSSGFPASPFRARLQIKSKNSNT